MIMEAEKSHDLWSASQRPRRAGGVTSVRVWNSKNQECQCPRARGDGCPSEGSENKFTHPLPFCSIQTLNGLDNAHLHWGGWSLLRLLTEMLMSSRNILTDTPRNNVYQLSWHPFAQQSWHIKLTITLHNPHFSVYFCCKRSHKEGYHWKIFLVKIRELYLKKETPFSTKKKISLIWTRKIMSPQDRCLRETCLPICSDLWYPYSYLLILLCLSTFPYSSWIWCFPVHHGVRDAHYV